MLLHESSTQNMIVCVFVSCMSHVACFGFFCCQFRGRTIKFLMNNVINALCVNYVNR